MEDHKRKILASWGCGDDELIVDCNPDDCTVTYSDGRVRQRCEVYTRVMGYHRPTSQFNPGKQSEHRDRVYFVE